MSVKVQPHRVFLCLSFVAWVRFCCPKKQSTPVSHGAKLAVSERWFLSRYSGVGVKGFSSVIYAVLGKELSFLLFLVTERKKS